jgi:2,4-dienoyl-CoA reductase-like NADH-dependent reductase (Old Yellow Enzyme family)
MPHLFEPLPIRSVTLANRIIVSPMCQYSSVDGFSNDWHFVHLGSRAVGGAALVMTEAAAVAAEGRISPQDLGIYDDRHVSGLERIVSFIHSQKTLAGIQLAHAGRKGSTRRPWEPPGAIRPEEGGWQPVGPTNEPFVDTYPVPRPLTIAEIAAIVAQFRSAALRALAAGFDVIELHAAHGYLLHEFLSPLSNLRDDDYGGSFANRTRFTHEVVEAVRRVWPERLPLFVRISSTDWVDGGWTIEDSVALARELRPLGVDLIDCSSGGNAAHATIPLAPGYQVPFAERVRRDAGLATGAVGLITAPQQAEDILRDGRADLIVVARQFLRDPYWAIHAAQALGDPPSVPNQYLRAY